MKNPTRHHTPGDDPEPGTPGTGEDIARSVTEPANRWTKRPASRQKKSASAATGQAK